MVVMDANLHASACELDRVVVFVGAVVLEFSVCTRDLLGKAAISKERVDEAGSHVVGKVDGWAEGCHGVVLFGFLTVHVGLGFIKHFSWLLVRERFKKTVQIDTQWIEGTLYDES